jgi:hypothetical protein
MFYYQLFGLHDDEHWKFIRGMREKGWYDGAHEHGVADIDDDYGNHYLLVQDRDAHLLKKAFQEHIVNPIVKHNEEVQKLPVPREVNNWIREYNRRSLNIKPPSHTNVPFEAYPISHYSSDGKKVSDWVKLSPKTTELLYPHLEEERIVHLHAGDALNELNAFRNHTGVEHVIGLMLPEKALIFNPILKNRITRIYDQVTDARKSHANPEEDERGRAQRERQEAFKIEKERTQRYDSVIRLKRMIKNVMTQAKAPISKYSEDFFAGIFNTRRD